MDRQAPSTALLSIALLLALALTAGCSGGSKDTVNDATNPPAATDVRPTDAVGTTNTAAQVILTDANLGAYARGLEKEAEIIRRPGRGTHFGVMVTGSASGGESGEVLDAAGMTAHEYLAIQDVVDPVFRTLNFQEKIGPPVQIDLDAISPELRQRLEGDPFAELPPESAAALRSHLEELAPLWSDVVALTAQHG